MNLTSGLSRCICYCKFRAEDDKDSRTAAVKLTAGNLRKLAFRQGKIKSLTKHIKPNKKINIVYKKAVAHYFQIQNDMVENEKTEVKKQSQSSMESCNIMLKLRNMIKFILVMYTGFVSVVLGAQQIRMVKKHGAEFPEKLDSETFVHGTYIKAAALVRHQLYPCIEPQNISDESRKI